MDSQKMPLCWTESGKQGLRRVRADGVWGPSRLCIRYVVHYVMRSA
jgi:hypothetical protein